MPIKPKRWAFTPVTQSTTNILAAVTPGAAGALTLDGALVVGGVLPQQTLAYILLFTTVSDESTKTVTIVGTDYNGKAQTETATALPNATTGFSTKAFRSINSITVSAALTGNLSIGTANATLSAYSPAIPLDIYSSYTTTACDVGGTINFTVQKCYEMINRGETPNWVTAQAAGAIDVVTTITGPVSAVRLQINSYTNTATLAMNVAQSGHIDLE